MKITNPTKPSIYTCFQCVLIATKYCPVLINTIVKRRCIACRRHFMISLALRSRKFYKTELCCSVQTPAFYTQ